MKSYVSGVYLATLGISEIEPDLKFGTYLSIHLKTKMR